MDAGWRWRRVGIGEGAKWGLHGKRMMICVFKVEEEKDSLLYGQSARYSELEKLVEGQLDGRRC